ncbi:hypothetical protein GGR21_002732 [Dysgonomonas hofstadii]|uniref:Uncharacterized protein n=1 Tax=Dysgonomonas hofstadii TaxID=637886 RepID=A0A840CQ57_9BACT|nr:hypothetical protein [Dysgonomonas hofstadii]MBB4036819.1 hypothetical protein [Dysgonomonas hofstadii]
MVSRRLHRTGARRRNLCTESCRTTGDYPALRWLRPVALSRSAGHPSGERGVKWKASAGQSFHLAREPVTGRTEDEPPKRF